MKSKTPALLITLPLILLACGKKKDKETNQDICLSRYQKMMECYQKYNRTHHPAYVERVCGQKYLEEGCYK